jgi:hypothetical protein
MRNGDIVACAQAIPELPGEQALSFPGFPDRALDLTVVVPCSDQ